MTDDQWAESPADLFTRLVDEVFRSHGALLAEGDALSAPHGLTAARWQVLGYLEDGPATVAEVARRRGLRRQSVQDTVNRLELDGMVTKVVNPDDRRAPLLHLTDVARDALAALEPARAAWASARAASVGQAELLVTLSTLQRLRAPGSD